MKAINLLIFILLIGCFNKSKDKISSNFPQDLSLKPVFEVLLKSGYFLNSVDSSYFLLMEGRLHNKTDSPLKLITMSCSIYQNIYFKSKNLRLVIHDCDNNYSRFVTLEPNEELRFPFLINVKVPKPYFEFNEAFAFVLVSHDEFRENNLSDNVFLKYKKENHNLIWSKPVILFNGSNDPYDIIKKSNK
jgi:hypothetical protein